LAANKHTDPAEVKRLHGELGSIRAVARALGVDKATVAYHLNRWTDRDDIYPATEVINEIPLGVPIDQLVARRCQEYEMKAAKTKAQGFRRIKVNVDGPVGILHFGDPHVDDDGTDLGLVMRHAELTRTTEGLFGANIGDVTNNWIGTLARLYGEQGTSKEQGREIAEYFLKSVDWLYLIGGNHDFWSAGAGVLDWFAQQYGYMKAGQFQYHGVRLGLEFPNGIQIRINARHDFRGASEHHPTHGPAKAARFGYQDHIIICGHRHTSGYELAANPDPLTGDGEVGILSHCIRVGAYKKIDSFAREKGLPYQNFAPGVVTILDPYAAREVNKVKVFLDPEHGADYLTWLRRRK